jgi:hypothetical protein
VTDIQKKLRSSTMGVPFFGTIVPPSLALSTRRNPRPQTANQKKHKRMQIGDILESKKEGTRFKVMEVFESLTQPGKMVVRMKRRTKTGKRIVHTTPQWLAKHYKKVTEKIEKE